MDASFYKALNRLADDIFACFLQADYEDKLYLYEHRIHSSKVECMSLLQKRTKTQDISTKLTIYNGLIDCGLLRWRIQDKSIFGICRTEMNGIKAALTEMLSSCEAAAEVKVEKACEALSTQIATLETINQSVLQVAAKEPLAFLLFIAGLKALKENCLAIYCTTSA